MQLLSLSRNVRRVQKARTSKKRAFPAVKRCLLRSAAWRYTCCTMFRTDSACSLLQYEDCELRSRRYHIRQTLPITTFAPPLCISHLHGDEEDASVVGLVFCHHVATKKKSADPLAAFSFCHPSTSSVQVVGSDTCFLEHQLGAFNSFFPKTSASRSSCETRDKHSATVVCREAVVE